MTDPHNPTLPQGATKYGDADLASKRRKSPVPQSEFDANEDEYNTVFTKRLIDATDLNSTVRPDEADYTGGLLESFTSDTTAPLSSSSSSVTKEVADEWQPHDLLSPNPSASSRGFENTFKVLESQMRGSSQLTQSQVNNLLRGSDLRQNPIFLNVPFGAKDRFLRAISEEPSGSGDDASAANELDGDNEAPSFLELELDARQRIRELKEAEQTRAVVSEVSADRTFGPSDEVDRAAPFGSMTEFLYGIPTHGPPSTRFESAVHEVELQQTGEYPEYVYHMAKGKDGRKYLRVVRSLLVDKVLCGNRVSQMTRTYDDIEAVTRLLEEKEKDLELTVQIGKELLTQNTRLENRVAELESDVKTANENLAQLSYDLHTKSSLLAALTNDEDVSSEASTPNLPKSFNLDLLQKKIGHLEDENKSLRAEATQLVRDTDAVEEQERRLMADITAQLNSAHYQYDGINLELERYREENKLQHEQIVHLTAKLTEAEIRLHQLTSENEEQTSRLSITEENQNMLAGELTEFKARYHEVLALLQETQEQLRQQRKRGQPQVRSNLIPGLGFGGCGPADSLQSELMETSLFSDHSLDSGIASDRGGGGGGLFSGMSGSIHHKPGYNKVFETVKCATKTGHYSEGVSQLGTMSMSSSSQPRMSCFPYAGSNASSNRYASSVYSNSTYPSSMGAKSYSRESLLSESEENNYPSKPVSGVPGAPGAKDLEAALKRLTPAQVLARRSMLSNAPPGTYNYDDPTCTTLPLGIRTPDSIMSTGSSNMSGLSATSGSQWRLPDKLQIVKPMEGSQTLHHWNRLATPTLGGLLDERPGVTIRGGRGLDELGLHVYSLSDVEEDAADDLPMGKQFQSYGSVYTFTNSTVLHPDDGTSVTSSMPPSQMSSRITSVSSSRQPSAPATPRHGMSRRNSCSTFSVNMGLASMLNERGIKGVTPSAVNTPAGPNYSPTVTPCNSPDGSPTRDRSPEPALFSGIFSSGADMLRRKIVGPISPSTPDHNSAAERQSRMSARNKVLLSRQEKRALRSLRLLEKVESIGLDAMLPSASPTSFTSTQQQRGISPLAMHASSPGFTGVRNRTASPMTQLTSLNKSGSGSLYGSSDDDAPNRTAVFRSAMSASESQHSLSDSEGSTTSSVPPAAARPSQPVRRPTSIGVAKPSAAAAATGDKQPSPTEARLKQMQRQKSRRALVYGQRPDLGTVGGKVRPDLGRVAPPTGPPVAYEEPPPMTQQHQTMTQSFVGTISSLFFGRKGGLL